MRTIIPISGGLDSTYLLWKTLTETSDDVTAVFFQYNATNENRIIYDLRAFNFTATNNICEGRCDQIVAWLRQNVRDFTYTKHMVDMSRFVPNQVQIPSCLEMYFVFMAIQMVNSNQMDQILSCFEKENDGFSNGGTTTVRQPSSTAVYDYFVSHAARGSIHFPLIQSNYNQAIAVKNLPSAIFNVTKSCDAPQEQPCNVCFKCRKRNMICEKVDAGQTPEQVQAYIDSKTITAGGKWVSMKYWIYPDTPQPYPEWDMPKWPLTYTVPEPPQS